MEGGGSQMSCIHSGNDQDDNGQLKFTEEQISEMMADYIIPMGKRYIELKMGSWGENDFWDLIDKYSDELLR